jgi:hypothetical protein
MVRPLFGKNADYLPTLTSPPPTIVLLSTWWDAKRNNAETMDGSGIVVLAVDCGVWGRRHR